MLGELGSLVLVVVMILAVGTIQEVRETHVAWLIHADDMTPEVHVTHVVPGELTMFMQAVTAVSTVKPKVAGSSETAVVGQRANAPLHN